MRSIGRLCARGGGPLRSIADWCEEISKQPGLLGSDNTHIGGNSTAIQMFANVVVNGIKSAEAKGVK